MRITNALILGTAGMVLTGCPEIDAHISLTSQRSVVTIDMQGACDGTNMITNDFGTTTWTKLTEASACNIVANWQGNLVPTADVKQKIEDEAGDVVSEVTVKKMVATLKDVNIENNAGADVTPPNVNPFSGTTNIAGTKFYEITTQNLQGLLADSISVTLEEPNPILDALNNVLNGDGTLASTANVEFDIPLSELMPLQGADTNPHKLVFVHDFEIDAVASLGL